MAGQTGPRPIERCHALERVVQHLDKRFGMIMANREPQNSGVLFAQQDPALIVNAHADPRTVFRLGTVNEFYLKTIRDLKGSQFLFGME